MSKEENVLSTFPSHGLSVPVNQPQDRADNVKDATKFPSLKITAYEFFIGSSLKISTGWGPSPAQ